MEINQEIIFFICQSVACSLSMTSCLLVVVLYTCSKSVKIYSFRLVFHLALQSCIRSVALLIPSNISEVGYSLCELTAYLFYASTLSSICLAFFVALSLYQAVFFRLLKYENFLQVYLSISMLVPYTVCLIPFIFGSYGNAGVNCLLKNGSEHRLFLFLFCYVPALVAIIWCLFAYWRIFKAIQKGVNGNVIQRDISRLIYFPLVFVVCVMPGVLFGTFEWFYVRIQFTYTVLYYFELGKNQNENDKWFLVTNFFWGIKGFFYIIVYSMSKPVITNPKPESTTEHNLIESRSSIQS